MIAEITKFIKLLEKLSLSILITLNVVLAILLFSPEKIAKALSVHIFVETYRNYLGPLFILLFSLLIVKIIGELIKAINRGKLLKQRNESLYSLTPEEKGHLSIFIHQNKNTICCNFEDGIAGGLLAKDIIYRASNTVNILEGTPYNLQPWARDHLNKNPQLLKGASGRPMTNEEKTFGRRGKNSW